MNTGIDLREQGELCQCCGKRYLMVYRLPNFIWKAIIGKGNGSGLLCPSCCDALAREAGFGLYWEATVNDFLLNKLRQLVAKEIAVDLDFNSNPDEAERPKEK